MHNIICIDDGEDIEHGTHLQGVKRDGQMTNNKWDHSDKLMYNINCIDIDHSTQLQR